MVAGKAHDHGSHAEIQVPCFRKRAHASVDERVSRLPCLPSLEELRVPGVCPEVVIVTGEVLGVDGGLVLELLHEVAVPAEASREGAESLAPEFELGLVSGHEAFTPSGAQFC